MSKNTYIDVHVLQVVPPSNLNRDDAGSPKQAIYGGTRRARVSSQSWKRATRKLFNDQAVEGERSTRTKQISGLLSGRLTARTGLDTEQADRLATSLLTPLGIKPGKKATDTAYLLFFGVQQLDPIVDLVVDRIDELVALDEKEQVEAVKGLPIADALLDGHPIDVALFGRMVADIANLNVDAAVQVAHAISTHAVDIEFDYYTAVDDEKERDDEADAGAGMIGNIEFNSATLYRYATVGLEQLVENLGGSETNAIAAVGRFLDGFVRSMPTGYINSFAHRTLPSAVVVTLRSDQPVNLVSAFEEAIRPDGGLVTKSIEALARELVALQDRWGQRADLVAATYDADLETKVDLEDAFGPARPFPEVLELVTSALAERRAMVEG